MAQATRRTIIPPGDLTPIDEALPFTPIGVYVLAVSADGPMYSRGILNATQQARMLLESQPAPLPDAYAGDDAFLWLVKDAAGNECEGIGQILPNAVRFIPLTNTVTDPAILLWYAFD